MVAVSILLSSVRLGAPVAEDDTALADYFVKTATFDAVIADEKDTIAGDKGTGKTALFKILKERFQDYPELDHVMILAAFNPTGVAPFQDLVRRDVLHEDDYKAIWKAYFFSIIGNFLLEEFGDARPNELADLENLLEGAGLRKQDLSPKEQFLSVLRSYRPTSIEAGGTVTAEGIPILAGKISFGRSEPNPASLMSHDDALEVLDRVLGLNGYNIWLVLDRLDEAFQASPGVEKPALRALLRAYLDVKDLVHVRLKMFVRRDLFARITSGGFVNLTHVNSRKQEIVWEDADLYTLLFNRFKESTEFLFLSQLEGADADEVFGAVFPGKVDPGERKPTTWRWILSRIRDGRDVKSPRNLVDLVNKAIAAQQRREATNPREFGPGNPLITGDALKQALKELSAERVEDTLLAEAGPNADLVTVFRNGKAEHNRDSLAELLGEEDLTGKIETLESFGFLEPFGENYKVPPLYRSGLKITNGKAFATDSPAKATDEDDDY